MHPVKWLVIAAIASTAAVREVPLAAGARTSAISKSQRATDPASFPVNPEAVADSVRVGNIRFEAPPPTVAQPAVLLKFEIVNDGLEPLTDPLIRISVTEKELADRVTPPRVIVQPFFVRGTPVIAPGYSIDYQMLMENLSVDCGCVANVTVVPSPNASPTSPRPNR
jgi:hypothetical protein